MRTEKDDKLVGDLHEFMDGTGREGTSRRVREHIWCESSCADRAVPETLEWYKENLFLASMHDILIVGWLANEIKP